MHFTCRRLITQLSNTVLLYEDMITNHSMSAHVEKLLGVHIIMLSPKARNPNP
jgi:hypothetical protein